jgi:hypothetical protein
MALGAGVIERRLTPAATEGWAQRFCAGVAPTPLANYARGSISGGAVDYQMAEPAGVGMQIYGALTRLAHLAHIENCCVFDP